MKRFTLTLIGFILWLLPDAHSQYKIQYWFDNQFALSQIDSISTNVWRDSLDVSNLMEGVHSINFHVQDSMGNWSSPHSLLFYKHTSTNAIDTSFAMQYTYWYDQDFENHHGDSIGNGHFLLDVSQLDEGIHTINLQLGNGRITHLKTYLFYKYTSIYAMDTSFAMQYTYWYDQDFENHHSDSIGNGHFLLDVSQLDEGIHTINLQFVDGRTTYLKTYMFYKPNFTFLDSLDKINRYEYVFNNDWENRHRTSISSRDTLRITTLLSVDTFPIRSSCFHFEANCGNPFICAKNDITFRFETQNNHLSEKKCFYVDYNVIDTIVADTLERDTTKSIVAPMNNNIHWFKLAVGTGDSLSFKTNQRCTMQLYSPSGAMVFHASADSVLSWDGCHAMENGVYYLAVHDAEDTGTVSVSYQWIYKYAILAWNVHRVGNGGISTITFKGNGFDSIDTVYLVKGLDTIPTLYLDRISNTTFGAIFNFENADTGIYNGIFAYTDDFLYKNNIVAVDTAEPIVLTYNVSHPSTFLRGNTVTYTLEIANTGNMTAYNVPLYTYIDTRRAGGITHIKFDGLNLPSIISGIDMESFTASEIKTIKDLAEKIGDDHYFFKFRTFDSISRDSIYTRINYFYFTIAPYETKSLSLRVSSTDAVNVWFALPDSITICTLHTHDTASDSSLFGTKSSNSRNNIKDWYCCSTEKMECMINLWATINDIASLVASLTGVEGALAAGIVSCATSAANVAIPLFNKTVCSGYNPDIDASKLIEQTVNSIIGAVLSCFSSYFSGTNRLINIFSNGLGLGTVLNDFIHGDLSCVRDVLKPTPNCPPTPPKGGESTPIAPIDPNEITGYIAESGSLAVGAEQEQLYYTIEFENDTNLATAHAYTVVVRDTLDGNVFDLNSFSSTAFSIGKEVTNINGLQGFIRTVDMRPDINTLAQVELDYTIDSGFAIATWTFSSLDPMTLRPAVADSLGFLRIGGTGEVNFLIRRKANLSDSTLINNRAYIVFDNEAPIATSTWRNIVDNTPPVSIIDSVVYNSVAKVHISATDNLSGVWRYDVYGQDSIWHKLAENVPVDSAATLDTAINQYSVLRAIAIDSAGNVEPLVIVPNTTIYQVLLFSDTAQGHVFGGGCFHLLDTVTISATSNYGFHFARWSDGDTNNPRIVTVLSDTTFTAVFDSNVYFVSLVSDDTNKGQVFGSGIYRYMNIVTISASPNYGFHFLHWNDGDTNNPRHFIVSQDTIFIAHFQSSQTITDVNVDGIIICVNNNDILLFGINGERVFVSDVLGRVIFHATVNERAEIAVKNRGVYFVKVGNRPAQKVVVM